MTPLEILFLDGNETPSDEMIRALESGGHTVTAFTYAEEINESAIAWSFDLGIIDANSTSAEGLPLALRLHEHCPDLGLILICRTDRLADRCAAYSGGVDLCLNGKTPAAELLTMIESLSRRLRAVKAEKKPVEFTLSVSQGKLLQAAGKDAIPLNPDEIRILQNLALAPDCKLEIWQLIEGMDREVTQKAKQNLQVAISRIRAKLQEYGNHQPFIRAIRGMGYRLCVPVEIV